MRILFLILIISVLMPVKGFSQISDYGIKIGAQSTSVFSDPSVDSRINGLSGYIFVDWQLNESLFTTFDLGFTLRGFKNAQNETNEQGQVVQRVEATSRINYLSFAPLLNIALSGKTLTPFFGLGPRFDLLIDRRPGEYEFTDATFPDETVNNFDDFVFGTSFVAGLKNISLKSIPLRLEAKYEIDITDSFSSFPREFRNNVIMFSLGVGF